MAKRRQVDGEKCIEAANGFGWTKQRSSVASVQSAMYAAKVFGITYELEKRLRAPGDTPDTGWYLYSRGDGYFFGEFCGYTLLPAIDEASEMIAKADLRCPGNEKEGEKEK